MANWILNTLHGLHILAITVAFLHRIFIKTVKDVKGGIYKLSALILVYAVFICIHDGVILATSIHFLYPMLWVRILFDVRVNWVNGRKKAVFISGCDSGFGNALARRLAEQGLKVFAGCLLKGQSGERELASSASSGNLLTLQLDVTDPDQINQAQQFVEDHLEKDEVLWAVVNNAGVNYMGEIELARMSDIERMMNINAMGQIRVAKTFLPLLRKSHGHVVNVASLVGNIPLYNLGGYCMSKFAVEAFSSVLRQEMMKWGVSVSVIEPGPYGTNIGKDIGEESYLEDMWEAASPDVKETYGWPYLQAYLTCEDSLNEPNFSEVIDAMEDAVMSSQPKWAYKMGKGAHSMPLLYALCPPLITPFFESLLKGFTLYPGATPKALQK